VPRKGVETLIDAMALLAGRPGGAPLLVAAGVGELRPGLEARAASLGLADRVRFVGKVGHDDVAWWMAAGDLFALPSLSEGLPTVVCEAMAVGRPVVATAVDGTPEIVADGETGYLVPPREPVPLADALSRVLDDPALAARLGARAHERALEEYTWAANARRMAAIYDELAGTR
jgi:glycosyltransferase involved in cell wall biosynthesis